ncbi:MAG: PEGA domain-containing protein, partial [Thermoanaerobaculia bacterium]|nr:PEGA domain-containing protein [Thermoanaerobaculia bacterium]
SQPRPYSGAATYREDREVRNAERKLEAEDRRAVDEAWRERQAAPAVSEDIGRLYLSVEPSDASVYLDGVFFGTARELAQLSAGMVVSPGEHVLQIVRPGYDDETREFSVEAGGDIGIELVLEEN